MYFFTEIIDSLCGTLCVGGVKIDHVIYLELLRRGFQVWVGKTKSGKEVDFVVRDKVGVLEYYQVAITMRSDETKERKLSALQSIDDNYRKYVLTLDPERQSYNGIEQINAIDWLLGK